MAEFESCNKCKHSNKSENESPCINCVHNAIERFEPQTNYDRIQNMSIEEMAEFLHTYFTCEYECAACNENCTEDCLSAIKEWLQAESEE